MYFAALTGPFESPYDEFSAGWAQLRQADAQLRDNFDGRYFGSGATDCDQGAKEALAANGIGNVLGYVVLHFPTLEEATNFAAGVEPPPLAVAEVRTYCRD